MENYDDMSDFEINKLVAAHLHGEEWWHKYSTVLTMQLKPTDSGGMETRKFPVNYCANPSDAWPIINLAMIEIKRDSCQAHVSSYLNPEFVMSCRNNGKEILRAAMICFLKMKDA